MKYRDNFYKKLEEAETSAKTPRVIESGQGAYLTIDGVKKLNFCSSHYLGLSVDPRLAKAAKRGERRYRVVVTEKIY